MGYFEKKSQEINQKSNEMESFIDNSINYNNQNNENIWLSGKAIKFIVDTKDAVNKKMEEINPELKLKTNSLISYVKNKIGKLSFDLTNKENLVVNLTKSIITSNVTQKINKILCINNPQVEPIKIKNSEY